MFRKFSVPLAALAAAAAAPALAQDSAADLRGEIEKLQQRLQKIEAREASQQQQQQTLSQLLDDAQRRSQLLQTGNVTAGYDKGFYIGSADGNFTIRPGVQFQFRSISNWAEGAKADGGDSLDNGFEVRRARFRFDGNAFTKDLKYSFVWDTARNGGSVSLLDAQVEYRFADDWSVRAGQFKESWTHEKDVSFTRQLAVERSLVDAELGGNITDRVQGVGLIYGSEANPLRAELSLHDGANSKNTDFRDSDGAGNARIDSNYGVGGRVEYKLFGDWGAYKDFTAKGTKSDLLVLGGGFDFTEAGDTNDVRATIDAQWENTAGWGAYAAVIGNFADGDDGNTTDYGFLAQGSYAFNPAWEAFGRYGLLLLDDDVNDNDTINEFTVGVNYYLGKDGSALHGAKFTLDFVYLPDGSPNSTGLGYVESDDAQYVLRGQFQLAL